MLCTDEGCELFKKYEQKTRRLKQLQQHSADQERQLAEAIQQIRISQEAHPELHEERQKNMQVSMENRDNSAERPHKQRHAECQTMAPQHPEDSKAPCLVKLGCIETDTDIAAELYCQRWHDAMADNIGLRMEVTLLHQRLDEALSLVDEMHQVDSMHSCFEQVCNQIAAERPSLQKAAECVATSERKAQEMERRCEEQCAALNKTNQELEQNRAASIRSKEQFIQLEKMLAAEQSELCHTKAVETDIRENLEQTQHKLSESLQRIVASDEATVRSEKLRRDAEASLKTKEMYFQSVEMQIKKMDRDLATKTQALECAEVDLKNLQARHDKCLAALEHETSQRQESKRKLQGMEIQVVMDQILNGVEMHQLREQAMQSHCTNEQLSQELHATKAMLGVLKAEHDEQIKSLQGEHTNKLKTQEDEALSMFENMREQFERNHMHQEERLTKLGDSMNAITTQLNISQEAEEISCEQISSLQSQLDEMLQARRTGDAEKKAEHSAIENVFREFGIPPVPPQDVVTLLRTNLQLEVTLAERDAQLQDERNITKTLRHQIKDLHRVKCQTQHASEELEQKLGAAELHCRNLEKQLEEAQHQVAASRAKSEKRLKIMESNLKNAEAEVDELDDLLGNCIAILKQHPCVLQENASLQVLFTALSQDRHRCAA